MMPVAQRILIICSAVFLMVVIFELVRKRRLREEYAWLWLLLGGCVLITTFIPFTWMQYFASQLGSEQPTAVIFFLGFITLILLCLQFSVRLSRQTEQIKNLGQKLALLEAERNETRSKAAERGQHPEFAQPGRPRPTAVAFAKPADEGPAPAPEEQEAL